MAGRSRALFVTKRHKTPRSFFFRISPNHFRGRVVDLHKKVPLGVRLKSTRRSRSRVYLSAKQTQVKPRSRGSTLHRAPVGQGPSGPGWLAIGHYLWRFLVWTGACYWHGVGGFVFNSSSSGEAEEKNDRGCGPRHGQYRPACSRARIFIPGVCAGGRLPIRNGVGGFAIK